MPRILITFIILIFAPQSQASIWSFINSTSNSGRDILYDYTISSWDYDDATPNPCFNTTCIVGISHRHTNSGSGGNNSGAGWTEAWYASASSGVACVRSSRTIGELGQCLRDNPSNKGITGRQLITPYSGTPVHHNGSTITQECVGIFYKIGTANLNGGIPMPGSICGIAPPPVGACGMPDNVEINHGSLSAEEVAGNQRTVQFVIDCNQKLSAKLFLTNMENDRLKLGDSGITSSLLINGRPLTNQGVPLTLAASVNTINVSSTLASSGNTPSGAFQGEGVLLLAMD